MCEESACLVPQLDQQQNGHPEPRLSSVGSGGGVGTAGEALVGFHEDALSHAAVGKAQILLAAVLGFGVAAECSEFTILGYILPSAELQLCIDEHRKRWLVSITLLASAVGSLAWGILGDRIGRRRALVSALSVTIIFSSVASVMPTYGTFMTARFCSGLGISGAIPLSFTYLAETCPRATRTRYVGLLCGFWPMGALLTSIAAHYTLPSTGAEVVLDNREHWSSWHKFLMSSTFPMIACIVGLIWASESPRYLLEASREVEALEVYQKIHRLNQRITSYGLTELELPGRSAYRDRPVNSSRNVFSHGVNTFREAFQRISSPSHFRTTLLLATLHLLIGFLYMGITTFSTSKIREINDLDYFLLKRFVNNANYTELTFNSTIENVQYRDTIFRNVTFTHLDLNHVEFVDCLFDNVEFSNVKSSITYFENSTIKRSRFIDTDLTEHHFVDCNLINNTFLSLISECVVDFDYNIYVNDLFYETIAWSGSLYFLLIVGGFWMEGTSRPHVLVALLIAASLVGLGIFLFFNVLAIIVIQAVIKIFLVSSLSIVTMVVIEGYPCHMRCTAHGVMRSLFHIACLCAIPVYSMMVHTMLLFPAAVSVIITIFAAILSTRVQDNGKVLL